MKEQVSSVTVAKRRVRSRLYSVRSVVVSDRDLAWPRVRGTNHRERSVAVGVECRPSRFRLGFNFELAKKIYFVLIFSGVQVQSL